MIVVSLCLISINIEIFISHYNLGSYICTLICNVVGSLQISKKAFDTFGLNFAISRIFAFFAKIYMAKPCEIIGSRKLIHAKILK